MKEGVNTKIMYLNVGDEAGVFLNKGVLKERKEKSVRAAKMVCCRKKSPLW